MTKLTLRGDALERAAARLGIPIPAPEEIKPQITPQEARRRRQAAVNALWARLAEKYPAAITPQNHAPRHPLKLGINRDIQERCPDVSLRTRREFLRQYVRQVGYLRLLVAGTARVGFDGVPSGEVTEDQAQNAVEKLAQRAVRNKRQDGGEP
jgi:sRNA-binding protein